MNILKKFFFKKHDEAPSDNTITNPRETVEKIFSDSLALVPQVSYDEVLKQYGRSQDAMQSSILFSGDEQEARETLEINLWRMNTYKGADYKIMINPTLKTIAITNIRDNESHFIIAIMRADDKFFMWGDKKFIKKPYRDLPEGTDVKQVVENIEPVTLHIWKNTYSKEYGPLVPGHTNLETEANSANEIIDFIINRYQNQRPNSPFCWGISEKCVVAEIQYSITHRVLERFIVLKLQNGKYHCYLAWLD
jgi:hypothetical protein